MAFCTDKFLQWHNIFHIVELIVSLISAALLVPVMQDDANTQTIFYTLLAWSVIDLVVLIVYFDSVKRLGNMDEVDKSRHYTLRAIVAVIIGLVYICEAAFLIQISSAVKGTVLGFQLASGLLAFITGVVHLVECLASRQLVNNANLMQLSYIPTCQKCVGKSPKPTPQV